MSARTEELASKVSRGLNPLGDRSRLSKEAREGFSRYKAAGTSDIAKC